MARGSDGQGAERRIASAAALRALLAEDYACHGRRLMSPGLHLVAVHRIGVWARGLGRAGGPVRFLHRVLQALVEGRYGSELPVAAEVGRRVHFVHAAAGIVVHQKATIGDDCLIRHNVTIGVRGDEPAGARGPRLGARVEVGAGAVIFGPIEIGADCLIGPNAVVSESVPAGSVVLAPRPEIRPRRRR
jgi:serine O-acetyltransferase